MDQCHCLSNNPLTPSLTQKQSTDNKLRVTVGLGEGKVHSCPDTDIDPSKLYNGCQVNYTMVLIVTFLVVCHEKKNSEIDEKKYVDE